MIRVNMETFYFINQEDPEKVLQIILELVSQRIPRRFGYDSTDDIQVLAPMHKGTVGAGNLNIELQRLLNPGDISISRGGRNFRIRDKVWAQVTSIKLHALYDVKGGCHALGLFNGDYAVFADLGHRFSNGVADGVVAVSDGVAMGTEGMKASLISREVVADSVELVSRGHLFDGLVVLTGCDKTNPGAAMAVARLDIPSVVLYNGTIYPGTYKGEPQDIVSVYEAVGAYSAGKLTLEELYAIEEAACPGAGACGGQFTANTMSMCLEFMGLSPAGLNGIPAEDPKKDEAAHRCGELVMDLVRDNKRPIVARLGCPSRHDDPSVTL